MKNHFLLLCSITFVFTAYSQTPRARDLGIPFTGQPGTYNAITDVAGIEVGYATIIEGDSVHSVGKGPVRTGVTAIFPRGKAKKFSPVYGNWYALNGNGEMTGTTWVTESGFLEGPVMITNTNSVGVVRDAVLKYYVETNYYNGEDWWFTYPVVAETYDGFLNDVYGFHVKEKHVFEAIDNAKSGKIAEGNVGGGTGMMCLGFKGGTGTASRVVQIMDSTYTIGVLVQSNFGAKKNLTIAGVPVGKEFNRMQSYFYNGPAQSNRKEGDGSIIVIVATDAPLLPHQLKRIAQRVPIGIGLVGGRGANGSGDIFLAFSTANEGAFSRTENTQVSTLANDEITPLFEGTIQAVEEAVINAMVAAETMSGINGNKALRLPHQETIEILKKYNRYKEPGEPKVNSRLAKQFEGAYKLEIGMDVTVSYESEKLYVTLMTPGGIIKHQLIPTDNYNYTFDGYELEFIIDKKQKVTGIIIYADGAMKGEKVK